MRSLKAEASQRREKPSTSSIIRMDQSKDAIVMETIRFHQEVDGDEKHQGKEGRMPRESQ
jgi:hypothetical protein